MTADNEADKLAQDELLSAHELFESARVKAQSQIDKAWELYHSEEAARKQHRIHHLQKRLRNARIRFVIAGAGLIVALVLASVGVGMIFQGLLDATLGLVALVVNSVILASQVRSARHDIHTDKEALDALSPR